MPEGTLRRPWDAYASASRCTRRAARNAEIELLTISVGLDVDRRTGWRIMYIQRWHWLDYDPVALAVLVIGIGMIELLALII